MKKINIYSTLLLLSLMAIVSCEKENLSTPKQSINMIEENESIKMIKKNELSKEASELLDKINLNDTAEKEVFKFDLDKILSEGVIDLNAASSKILSGKFTIVSSSTKASGNQILKLKSPQNEIKLPDGSLQEELEKYTYQTLVIDEANGAFYGSLRIGDQYGTISSIGKGEAVLIKIDVAKMGNKTCETVKENAQRVKSNNKLNENNRVSISQPTIKVLILYSEGTNAAAFMTAVSWFGNMLADYMANEFNEATKGEVNFVVTANVAPNTNFNVYKGGGFVSVKVYANIVREDANLVQYVVQNANVGSSGEQGAGDLNDFFSVIREGAMISIRGSIHEIGHNFGMHHDWNQNKNADCFHGGLIKMSFWGSQKIPIARTIMSYPHLSLPLVNNFSSAGSPILSSRYLSMYNGTPCTATGTTTGTGPANNFDRIRTQKNIIANWK
ncbi:MAG: hypothetical protein P8P55_01985 [Flavobacteriaceae bacterium]|jgi:hypothetical protein|nr:hypothetical protein [Flavobacteriaceae bacterium]